MADQIPSRTIQYSPRIVVRQEVQSQYGDHLQMGAKLAMADELRHHEKWTGLQTCLPVNELHGGVTKGATHPCHTSGSGT
jgi:hypothetical protein